MIKPEFVPVSRFLDERGQLIKILPETEEYLAVNYAGVFRGMHMTLGQAKTVTCIKGYVVDYVVDARRDSDEFGKPYIFRLGEDTESLYIPEGFLHGYYSPGLSVIHYAMDTPFDEEKYITINANSIRGIPVMGSYIRSKKDKEAMTLTQYKEKTRC